ncbi:MAG: helix-turn-helix transcriptional regulator [Sandaracinaceae bacterium]|nr:helix-turn-helix transcriptional regulator [Sandaracinaceae bacterium]
MRNIGRRVAEHRRAHEWTQAALAERLGVTSEYLQRIEAGRENLSIRSLVEIANGLGDRIAALLEEPVSRSVRRAGRPPKTRS